MTDHPTGYGPLREVQQQRGGGAAYAAVLAIVTLGITGAVGLLIKQPWLFPSLGPTVMLFFESPKQPSARPLNTIVGHVVGIAAGVTCYTVFGLSGHRSAPVGGLTVPYVIAGAVAVGITTAVLSLLKLPHPPGWRVDIDCGAWYPAHPRSAALYGGRRAPDHDSWLGVQSAPAGKTTVIVVHAAR